MTDGLAVNGLVDFSLRRAARAAGTTHKVHWIDPESAKLEHQPPRTPRRMAEP